MISEGMGYKKNIKNHFFSWKIGICMGLLVACLVCVLEARITLEESAHTDCNKG